MNLILIFAYIFLNKKRKSRYSLSIKNIQYNILFRVSMSEPFSKISTISDEYEYLNIRIELPSNIIRICIFVYLFVSIL